MQRPGCVPAEERGGRAEMGTAGWHACWACRQQACHASASPCSRCSRAPCRLLLMLLCSPPAGPCALIPPCSCARRRRRPRPGCLAAGDCGGGGAHSRPARFYEAGHQGDEDGHRVTLPPLGHPGVRWEMAKGAGEGNAGGHREHVLSLLVLASRQAGRQAGWLACQHIPASEPPPAVCLPACLGSGGWRVCDQHRGAAAPD